MRSTLLVVVLALASAAFAQQAQPFRDVPPDSRHNPVTDLAAAGIFEGYPAPSEMRDSQPVPPGVFPSWAEDAVISMRETGIMIGHAIPPGKMVYPYRDVPVTHWAAWAVRKLYDEGIMVGAIPPNHAGVDADVQQSLPKIPPPQPRYTGGPFTDIPPDRW